MRSESGTPSTLRVVRDTIHLLTPRERRRLAVVVAVQLVVSVIEVIGTSLVFLLLSFVVSRGDSSALSAPIIGRVVHGTSRLVATRRLAVLVAGYAVARLTVSAFEQYLQHRRAQELVASMSERVFAGYATAPLVVQQNFRVGDVMRDVVTNTDTLFRAVVFGIIAGCGDFVAILAVGTALILVAPLTALIGMAVITALLVAVYLPLRRRLSLWGAHLQSETADCYQTIHDTFGAMREAKLHGAEESFTGRFNTHRTKLARTIWRFNTASTAPRLLIDGAVALGLAVAVLLSVRAGRVASSDGSVALVAAAGYTFIRFLPAANRLANAFNSIAYGATCLAPLRAALQIEPEHVTGGTAMAHFERCIELRNVTVRYPGSDTPVLVDVNLTITKGERVGVVGPSGGGKSSLVDILAGLIEPDTGSVLVDGEPIHGRLGEWRRAIGFVSQAVYLVDGSVRDNVAFGVDPAAVDDDAVWSALERAQVAHVIRALPDGLGQRLGESGTRISGGERQRLAIARALYRQPLVLIFDEATSALDAQTEEMLKVSIRELSGDHTVIVVSHRTGALHGLARTIAVREGHVTDELVCDEPAGAPIADRL